MLPCICSEIHHRGCQNVVRTSVTHSAIALCATFLFLPHFDVNMAALIAVSSYSMNNVFNMMGVGHHIVNFPFVFTVINMIYNIILKI